MADAEDLAAAITRIAAAEAREILAEALPAAREQARERVRALLVEALSAEMVEQATRALAEVETATADGEAVYAFGVIRAAAAETVERALGVRVLATGSLAAVTRPVALSEFGEDALRVHLEDFDWVQRTAEAHEAVLDALLELTTVVPLRMCTVYRSAESLGATLAGEREALEAALARLDGREEWGVQMFCAQLADGAAAVRADAVAPPGLPGEPGPGTGAAYMTLLRERRDQAEAAEQTLLTAVEAIDEPLARLAAAARRQPLRATEAGAPMRLNAVYLVDRERREAFTAEVDRLREIWGPRGAELRLTGPWPAYNFAAVLGGEG